MKVFVGLSGGVDSAVSAALLREQGHEVTGVFIKIWQPEFTECTWEKDRLDAMRVAVALEIPFREIDLSDSYKKEIVRDMIDSYARGETPNPDVLCNRVIKFGAFAQWAFSEGAEAVATGHYARVLKVGDEYQLLRGCDLSKDQSYFLWQLKQEDLARIVFPVGSMQKGEVRAYALAHNLPNAIKPDSQGLCFVGAVSILEFLARYIRPVPGDVLDEKGRVIGRHNGAAAFTVGERRGFTLFDVGAPHYVIALDTTRNAITVSPDRSRAARREVPLRDAHWTNTAPSVPFEAEAQVRYREAPQKIMLVKGGTYVCVRFDIPIIAAPGQSLVVYDGDRCLGGGIIARM